MPNGHTAIKDEMTANTNHGSVATDKDGGVKWWHGKKQMRQTNKKYVVRQARSSYQMGQTNEDVVKGQPRIVPTKSRCDDTAINKKKKKMHQQDEKWQHDNEQEWWQKQTTSTWRLTIW